MKLVYSYRRYAFAESGMVTVTVRVIDFARGGVRMGSVVGKPSLFLLDVTATGMTYGPPGDVSVTPVTATA